MQLDSIQLYNLITVIHILYFSIYSHFIHYYILPALVILYKLLSSQLKANQAHVFYVLTSYFVYILQLISSHDDLIKLTYDSD
jgi:hypothetical protein